MSLRAEENGLEVLKKSAEYIGGDPSQVMISTKSVPQSFDPPLNAQLMQFEDSEADGYFVTIIRYFDGGTPGSPGNLIQSRTIYYSDFGRCNAAWSKIGEP